jgi:hypothetical protein
MRRYFFLPFMGIKDQRMKKLLFMIIAGAACSGAALAQSQRQISNILRDQQQWKMKQLPANSVLQNFGSTAIYAAATWLEQNKSRSRPMQAIAMPKAPNPTFMRPMGMKDASEDWQFSYANMSMQTSFMKWLTAYLPPYNNK